MTASAATNYASIRENVDSASDDALSRVEVNQRALIDKILARYASQGAVYRELIQNSNDANANQAEIYFTTTNETSDTVAQVVYRNNGMPFRGQDWDRLKKIAEGNPDVSKVGAFGVGAYTMFSICEEPLVLSGNEALAFVWKGDALWTKTIPNTINQTPDSQKWTSFVLPSRDPYPVPNLVEFGEFLCASLTFTAKLKSLKVFVNDKLKLHIHKSIQQQPRLVQTPSTSSSFFGLWNSNSANTSSTKGVFSLAKSSNGVPAIYESIHRMTVIIENDSATLDARYVSATAKTSIPSDMARRMERVTKKQPPSTVDIQVFLNAASSADTTTLGKLGTRTKNKAQKIVKSFSPRAGQGRIFIGFRTSQTTGLAAHLAAPFVPTVEREAMDLQDVALRTFNTELLEFSGIILRLTLEHTMFNVIGVDWEKHSERREKEERELKSKQNNNIHPEAKVPLQSIDKANIDDDDDDNADYGNDGSTTQGSGGGVMMGFARFMARGVQKSIVSVAKTVGTLVEASVFDPLLYPSDPRPLCMEETQAIVLMQSFCPQQSTPDAAVGTFLATGFSRCLPNQSPPVLTRSGVMRGDLARLPHYGIESFCQHNTIRNVVLQNCKEYHEVIARCKRLSYDDLYESISNRVLEEEEAIVLIKWWVKYTRVESIDAVQKGVALKQIITFHPLDELNEKVRKPNEVENNTDTRTMIQLNDWNYYFDKESYYATHPILPLPDSVITRQLQEKISPAVLSDTALHIWFSTLPIEVWTEYISKCRCMTDGRPEDEFVRVQVLACLSQEYSRRLQQERIVFGGLCSSLFTNKRCIPFDDTSSPSQYTADYPGDLYLSSAELKAFQGVSNAGFRKVALSLRDAGVTDEFLLCLGVRKSVSIDFLFTNLDTLRWSEDPKALIEYLQTATLDRNDINKLMTTQYLPAHNDNTQAYAPSQLYIPNSALKIFPFVKLLHWPSETDVSDKSLNGQFMVKLGMSLSPKLTTILEYVSRDDLERNHRMKCLDFLCDRLGPHGVYHASYTQLSSSQKSQYRFLPCRIYDPVDTCFTPPATTARSMDARFSPTSCYFDEICSVMGFPVIDQTLIGSKNNRLYGSIFQCEAEPESNILLRQFMNLVTKAKATQKTTNATTESVTLLEATFTSIFNYLSHRCSDFSVSSLNSFKQMEFIPVKISEEVIEWYRPDQVFFHRKEGSSDSITSELFKIIEFNSFLAAAGVKEEATTKDLFLKVLNDPEDVLETLGSEKKYRSLLRRIAANPPFHPNKIPNEVKNSPFLLAYTVKPSTEGAEDGKTSETSMHQLAKASDIYIIDNSFFARMFPVKRAPPESDLEDFYARLGAKYISQSVNRRFEIVGRPSGDTSLTLALQERLNERGPLLVSPSVTSRPLVPNASSILEHRRLQVFEVKNLLAVYSLDGTVRRSRTTCCSQENGNKSNAIYVVHDFDWFDVGYAIGDLILRRCQLEDAFFISSLLEAPLEQLRSRGFPVDRILQSESAVKVAPGSPIVSSESLIVPKDATPSVQPNPPTIAEMPPRAQEKGDTSNQQKQDNTSSIPQSNAVNNDTNGTTGASSDSAGEGVHEILQQMFPQADPDFIRKSLGPNPTIDDVRELAEKMSKGNYPTKKVESKLPSDIGSINKDNKSTGKSTIKNKLGRVLGFGGSALSSKNKLSDTGMPTNMAAHGFNPPSATNNQQSMTEREKPVSPAYDSQVQKSLEQTLEDMVEKSTKVDAAGTNSLETKMTSIPADLDHNCEIIPAQSLKPFLGPRGTGKSQNGIRLFSSRLDSSSEAFLNEYDPVLESFAHVIERLCVGVFALNLDTIAIFHDPSGKVIAFNSNRSLHFNIRYFHSLHFLQNQHLGIECYSYWYVTIAHELAHHLVSGHTREHGFYTESYATHYLPKLVVLLNDL